jgi:hypothetical protein
MGITVNAASVTTPPFNEVAKALRKTTEYLASELVNPSDRPPEWSDLEWSIARATCAIQGISALLARRIQWSGPRNWQAFLSEQREHMLLRHTRIVCLLEQMDAAFRKNRVEAVALKGSAILKLGLYHAGDRPMADIDILVRSDALEACGSAIESLGFQLALEKRRHEDIRRNYEPLDHVDTKDFGEHIDNPLKVEVHTRIAEALPVRKTDITDSIWPIQLSFGLNSYSGLHALFLHELLHAAGNMRAHAARQIQFQDIALLSRKLDESDWGKVLVEPLAQKVRWWIYPPLVLTNHYYPGAVPEAVIRQARAGCTRLLVRWINRRTLTDVTYSNLRISAFPGLSWSRNPVDALRFIHSRVFPERSARQELVEAVATYTSLQRIPWYGLSHARRIFRWLVSSPPRVQTMTSVLAAIQCAHSRD